MLYHDDGILDIVVGVTILMLTAVMAFEEVAFVGLIGIPLVLYVPIKREVSMSRIGVIRFESQNVTRRRLFVFLGLGCAALLVSAVLVLFRTDPSSLPGGLLQNNLVLVFALILGATLFAAGRIMENLRFVVYALLGLALTIGLSHIIGLRVWTAILILGLLMVTVGTYKLVGFLRTYPLESGE